MKLDVSIKLNLKTAEVTKAVKEAARLAMRDRVVTVAREAIGLSRVVAGNNRRSIFWAATGFPHKQASPGRHDKDTWTGPDQSLLDESKLQGVIYSTSRYGGYLETGTKRNDPRPYLKPALDMHFTAEKFTEDMKRHLKS